MTNQLNNLPLKFSPYVNHLLYWSIRDEISHGRHTFEGLYALILGGESDEVRKYSEVLIHKTKQEETLLDTIKFALSKRVEFSLESKELLREFDDWGFYYDSITKKVNVVYKTTKQKPFT